MTETSEEQNNWFSKAAKSSVLNSLWLGPLNIFLWFNTGRFEEPYYANMAELEEVHIDQLIGVIIIIEMLLLVLSLFTVMAIFFAAKAPTNVFTNIIIFVFATLLWIGLGILFGL